MTYRDEQSVPQRLKPRISSEYALVTDPSGSISGDAQINHFGLGSA